jgi:hypothetical protein
MMIHHHDAALGRFEKLARKRIVVLTLFLLLPVLTSGCRNIIFPTHFLERTIAIHPSEIHPSESYRNEAEEESADTEVSPSDPPEVSRISEVSTQGEAAPNLPPEEPMPAAKQIDSSCQAVSLDKDQILTLPKQLATHAPVRIIATAYKIEAGDLSLIVSDEQGASVTPERLETWGYLPRAYSAYFPQLAPGAYNARLIDAKEAVLVCTTFKVLDMPPPAVEKVDTGVWTIEQDWSPALEDIYSVFVAKLFYVRPGGQKGWRPLHQATQDPYRNILYGVKGYDEDKLGNSPNVKLAPDCADAPFQLRAYFAWKLGLPFMFNRCKRGSSISGPKCFATHDNLTTRFDGISHPVERFNAFVSTHVGWKVHSGNGRTLPSSDEGDLYPIALTPETIRPGAVYVDAGGHVITVSQVEPQSESRMGTLYGIDAHPDRTVTHKQFDIGTFVFNHRVPTDGFKMFRPQVRDGDGIRFLTNQEIIDLGFPAWSATQAEIDSKDVFYGRITKFFNPVPLDPKEVLRNKLGVLHKAMLERVEAVELGVAYMKENNWREMAMPSGAAIFQTTGPWEIYSTPARDMRCFLSMDDVATFPNRAVRDRAQYAVDPKTTDDELLESLEVLRDEELKKLTISYMRSDGSSWELTLADVMERQELFEMAYNPNDCIEIRWGAPPDSDEMSTCERKAPPDQRFKMRSLRRWFASRRRPDQR